MLVVVNTATKTTRVTTTTQSVQVAQRYNNNPNLNSTGRRTVRRILLLLLLPLLLLLLLLAQPVVCQDIVENRLPPSEDTANYQFDLWDQYIDPDDFTGLLSYTVDQKCPHVYVIVVSANVDRF